MTRYIELIDKYEIRQSDSDEYNPPSYIWRDNTGEIIRCKDCKYFTRDTITGVTIPGSEYCIFTANNRIEEEDFCSRAERKEE